MTMYGSRINICRCPKPPGLYNTVSNNKKTLILYIKRNRYIFKNSNKLLSLTGGKHEIDNSISKYHQPFYQQQCNN